MANKKEKLTKKEIITKISEIVELTKVDVESTIDALISVIISELQVGHDITLPGLGTFSKQFKPERVGLNPTTKEKIFIPSKNVPKFKAAKNLKDAVGLTE